MTEPRLTAMIARDWLDTLRRTTQTMDEGQLLPVVLGKFRYQNPYVCEEIVLRCFAEAGFQVWKPKGYTGDDGVDGMCTLDGCHFLIQVKRYQKHVSLSHIEHFIHLVQRRQMSNPDTVAGFFVHSGKTGATSKAVINHGGILILVSGMALVQFLLDPLHGINQILETYHDQRQRC